MFIEQSRYRSGTRVRIMQKVLVDGIWKKQLVRHIGTARHELDLAALMTKAEMVKRQLAQGDQIALPLPSTVQASRLQCVGESWIGAETVLGCLFDRFNLPRMPLLRHLVIARILWPVSKRRTAVLLGQCLGSNYSEDQIYRSMDKLAQRQKSILDASRSYLVGRYPASIGYVFYDVTTLYFETDREDEDSNEQEGLRKKGYSKDHREDLPQVVLGLAVNSLGMPLAYQLHSGNTYEGHTLLSGIDATLDVLPATTLTVVADAGMLSSANLATLEQKALRYIVGARLKSLTAKQRAAILALDFKTTVIHELPLGSKRLVVSYSQKRADRARRGRERSVARLERLIAKGTAVRKHTYLDFSVQETPKLNQAAIDSAAQWDGIKGYITNNHKLSAREVIARYTNLYRVEQSFRMSKSDLRIRPTFHYKQERIVTHVVICMLALSILRMLEQEVQPLGMTIGAALRSITDMKAALVQLDHQLFTIPPVLTPEQQMILERLGVDLVT